MKRNKEFQRNDDLEQLLEEINTYFSKIEKQRISSFSAPKYPVVFIVGSPRSGTTLLIQFLAYTGKFGYPSNLISRFYKAPYWGIKIQQLIADPKYNYKNELTDVIPKITFKSHLGKTKGMLAPNEFWYFWRRFLPEPKKTNKLDSKALEKIDTRNLCREFAAMENAFNKPLLFKALIMNWNINFLFSIFNQKPIFIYIKRDIRYNIQSLIKARKDFWGSEKTWYSFKPPEFKMLQKLHPVKQVAGQIYYTNKAIEKQLKKIPLNNRIELKYKDFCHTPEKLLNELSERFDKNGISIDFSDFKTHSFKITNKVKVSEKLWNKIEKASNFFENHK